MSDTTSTVDLWLGKLTRLRAGNGKSSDGMSIVDAAHIEPWAETGNDDLGNGLALSKSAHGMFDAGLWAVDDDLRVVVNPTRFTEAGPDAYQLRTYAGRHLQFAPQAKLRPAAESLRSHRLRFGPVGHR
jgi:putative restriction endonuclease